MKPKTLTLLILSAIVMASIACGTSGFGDGYQKGYSEGHTAGLAEGKQKLAEDKQKSATVLRTAKKQSYDEGYNTGYSKGRNVGQQEGWNAHIAEQKKTPPTNMDRSDAETQATILMKKHYPDGTFCYLDNLTGRDWHYDSVNETWVFKVPASTELDCKREQIVQVYVDDKTGKASFVKPTIELKKFTIPSWSEMQTRAATSRTP